MSVKAKVDSTYFVVMDTREADSIEVIQAQSIGSPYSEVTMYVPAELITEAELIDWGKSIWGDRVYQRIGDMMTSFLKGEAVCFNDEARHMPSFNNVYATVIEQEHEIEIPVGIKQK